MINWEWGHTLTLEEIWRTWVTELSLSQTNTALSHGEFIQPAHYFRHLHTQEVGTKSLKTTVKSQDRQFDRASRASPSSSSEAGMASIIPHLMKDLSLSTTLLKKHSEGHKSPLNIIKSSQQPKLAAWGLCLQISGKHRSESQHQTCKTPGMAPWPDEVVSSLKAEVWSANLVWKDLVWVIYRVWKSSVVAVTVAVLSTTLGRPLGGKCHDIFNSSLVETFYLCVSFFLLVFNFFIYMHF